MYSNLRRLFAIFACSILTFYAALASGASPQDLECEVARDDNKATISFSADRKFTIVGQSHGITIEVMSLARIADDTSTPNDQFIQNAKAMLANFDVTLNQYKESVRYLRQAINEGDIDYIALEYGDQIMEMMTYQSKLFLPMAKENFKNRGLEDNQIIDDAYLVFAGPAHYLVNTSPDLMKSVRIVGVEDDSLMQESLDMMTDGEARLDNFFSKIPGKKAVRDYVEAAYVRTIMEYDQHENFKDDWLFQPLSENVPQDLIQAAKDPLYSALVAANLLRKRDAKSSKKLLQQNGSGVLFIGSAHLNSLSKILQNECLNTTTK